MYDGSYAVFIIGFRLLLERRIKEEKGGERRGGIYRSIPREWRVIAPF